MELTKWGSTRSRKSSLVETLDTIVAKVTSHLESVFSNLAAKDDTGGAGIFSSFFSNPLCDIHGELAASGK